MKHETRSVILKQLAVLLIVGLHLSLYIASVDRTRDLASTDVAEMTVWNAT